MHQLLELLMRSEIPEVGDCIVLRSSNVHSSLLKYIERPIIFLGVNSVGYVPRGSARFS